MKRRGIIVASIAVAAVLGTAPADAQGPAEPAGPGGLTRPGVSLELAEHRAATLFDVAYDLAFRLPADPDGPVTGEVTIRFRKQGAQPLILDFAETGEVHGVAMDGRPVEFRRTNDHLLIPAAPAGEHSVTIRFTAGDGPLNRREDFLYTLFVPDRAHEVFPSFDQPNIKAAFQLRLTIPADWVAVANGAVVDRQTAGDSTVLQFSETRPLPTYLFSFAAGRFQVETAERGGRTMRLFHRETDEAKVERSLETLFDLHARSLDWLEEYTGVEYPFGPFDFVAIPSFQYNGMEHPGAILYRASSLFLDESATRSQELGRASVIAHETAHMWFGDLVTMRWFSDVWMKEVFANFMAAKIVNPAFPEIDHDLRFLLAHYPSAYGVDRTAGANSVRQPLENLDEAGSLYGAIIYQKAPIVMRQLEELTGEDAFRTALRRYLADNPYGNAGWPDLVAELDAVTPLDVAAWSRVWIEEAGRPTVTVQRAGARAVLSPSDPTGEGRVWPQRTTVAAVAPLAAAAGVGGGAGSAAPERAHSAAPVTIAGEPVAVDVTGPAIVPNARGLGYGLFLLDEATVETLLRDLPKVSTPLVRAAAWLDLWEMMLEGAVSPVRMLDLATRMVAGERDDLVLEQVLGDLTSLYWRFVPSAVREREAGALEDLLWTRMIDAPQGPQKAALFNAWRRIAVTPAAVRRMADVWAGELEVEGLPLSDRDRSTLALNLAVREAPGWAEILDRQEEAIENPDRKSRFRFIRPAASPDPAARDSFFASLAEPESRSREEWVVAALDYLHHPLRAERSVRYIRPGLDLLREVHRTGDIFFPTRWLAGTLGGHSSPEAAAIVREFIVEHPDYPPRLMGKLLQEADPLFRSVALRKSARSP